MHPSHLPGGGSPPLVPPRAASPSLRADDPRGWQVGWHEKADIWGWLGFPGQSYELPLFAQSGAIFGEASADLDTTLLRLAENAAAHGWKVIYFDAQGSHQMAVRFLATMGRHGKTRTYIFPNAPYAGLSSKRTTLFHHLLAALPAREPYYQQIAALGLSAMLTTQARLPQTLEELVTRLSELVEQRKARSPRLRAFQYSTLFSSLRPMELVGIPLRYAALSTLVGTRLDGSWTFGQTDGAYLSFDAWNRPEQSRVLAQFLLRELASTLAERTGEARRVLLLLKRPSLLFHSRQIAPLFALLEHYGGSVFLAERSPFDLSDSDRERIMGNASTLLVHRSSSLRPFAPYIAHPFPRSFADARISALSHEQGYAIAAGRIQALRVKPVLLSQEAIRTAERSIPPHIEYEQSYHGDWQKAPSILDDDLDLFDLDNDFPALSAIEDEFEDLADLLEPDEPVQPHTPALPPSPGRPTVPVPTKRASRHTRSKSLRSNRSRRNAQAPSPDVEEEEDTYLSLLPESYQE